ncbi:MAG: F-type H+-transporting ATPase subunit alpha, partial [Marivirga sp.]
GTLKLDQAQFRELEAFSKFGSDLDAVTRKVIERGKRNQEILKQAQYSPVSVEQQVAIIIASTKGFIDKVPVNKVREFEKEFSLMMSTQEQTTLDAFKAGKFSDDLIAVVEKVAKDLASKY